MSMKKRESNLELFRIIVMLAIIGSHYNTDLYGLMYQDPLCGNSIFHFLFGM